MQEYKMQVIFNQFNQCRKSKMLVAPKKTLNYRLPFVLHTEGETRVCCLRIPLSNSAEGDHCSRPLFHHPNQPFPLLLSAPNEAAEVALPSRVVDVEAKAFKGLAGSVFILSLANVVGFAGLGEVPVLRPKLHKKLHLG